jgi:hypothetical protein
VLVWETFKMVMTVSARRSILAAIAAGVLTLGSTGIAQAQWFTYRPPVIMDELTPREVNQIVYSQGYRQPSRPVYRDDVVIVAALTPSGQRVRLVLDVYSGRIVDRLSAPQERPKPREQVVQRAPDQGPTIRRTVPDVSERARATPERPSTIKREPMLPPQPALPPQARPSPEKPAQEKLLPQKPIAAQPLAPTQPPQASVGSGTKAAPRRVDMVPPAELDSATPAAKPPVGAPINSVPPAALE